MRFGLFGTGFWAIQTQGAALSAEPDVEFVGVWGRDPDKARVLAARYGVRAFTRADDLLAEVDAVAVALPPQVQVDVAIRAARAGCHLLLDKPLALTCEDADRVVAAVDEAGVASVVFFTQRFSYNVQTFIDAAAGQLWDGARVTMLASIFQPGGPYAQSRWRRDKGGLWDIGPHALSLVLPVLGEVDDVVAMAGPHDTSHVLLHHRTGAVSTLTLTLDAPTAAVSYEFLLYGPDGVVAMPNGEATPVGAFGAAIRQLTANVHAGVTTHPCDVRFARDVVAILARAQHVRVPR